MKKYLLTWYGITDLRSSLGFEKSNGPVLAALLAETYTDVMILGYTNGQKDGLMKQSGGSSVKDKLPGVSKAGFPEQRNFIDEIANTGQAHTHFVQWLRERLLAEGVHTVIHFDPVYLSHLNDTEGIYDAATELLNRVSAGTGTAEATLYLSPGTPVMAFVWAFAALRHPKLDIRLIASPQPEKPPVQITLPNEWMEWHGRHVTATSHPDGKFNVIFHLFGEQRIPNLLGVQQFETEKHVFVSSENYPAAIMKQFMGKEQFAEIVVDPYNPENVRSIISRHIEKLPLNLKVGFNLTGGTKLMYAGALAACRKHNATPFYFDSRNNQVVFLNDFSTTAIKPIPQVESFLKLNSSDLFISKDGLVAEDSVINSPERKTLGELLWKNRYKLIDIYTRTNPLRESNTAFEVFNKSMYFRITDNLKVDITIDDNHFEFSGWMDFAKYLSGGWFEEYTFVKLRKLLKAGIIQDLRLGLELSYKETATGQAGKSIRDQMSNLLGEAYQDLDVTFTDGKRLYIVECKAGNVVSDDVMKLQNIARFYGGIEGRAILALCKPPKSKIVQKKIEDAKNITVVYGDVLAESVKSMIRRP